MSVLYAAAFYGVVIGRERQRRASHTSSARSFKYNLLKKSPEWTAKGKKKKRRGVGACSVYLHTRCGWWPDTSVFQRETCVFGGTSSFPPYALSFSVPPFTLLAPLLPLLLLLLLFLLVSFGFVTRSVCSVRTLQAGLLPVRLKPNPPVEVVVKEPAVMISTPIWEKK